MSFYSQRDAARAAPSTPPAPSAPPPVASPAYDPRNLQSKALQQWERQQAAWRRMQRHLLTATGRGDPSRGRCANFATSGIVAREQMEDFNLISSTVPQAALESLNIWESLLRCNNEYEARRFVPIGKVTFPYALFSEIRDRSNLRSDHPDYTRIISADREQMPFITSGTMSEKVATEARSRIREAMAAAQEMNGTTTTNTAAISSFLDVNNTEAAYYEEQLLKFAPYVRKRLPHFLLPREFLSVEGTPAPRLTSDERSILSMSGEDDLSAAAAPPVRFYPPPQTMMMPTTPSISRRSSETKQGDRWQSSSSSAAATTATTMKSGTSAPHGDDQPSSLDRTREGGEDLEAETFPSMGPAMELSSDDIVFQSHPGELVHGTIRLCNTGSTTIYYSLVDVDMIQEEVQTKQLDSAGGEDEHDLPSMLDVDGKASHSFLPWSGVANVTTAKQAESKKEEEDVHSQPVLVAHQLAAQTRRAKSYFYVSSPENGVVLPSEEVVIAFSLRAPREGCFSRNFEILTVPSSMQRLLVKLRAFVFSGTPPVDWLATPIEQALNAKVIIDSQRRLMQGIVSHPTVYDKAELLAQVKALDAAAQAKEAQLEIVAAQRRAAWQRFNQSTFDHLPFNRAVMEKLVLLHRRIDEAMTVLQSTSHGGPVGTTPPPPSLAAAAPAPPAAATTVLVPPSSLAPSNTAAVEAAAAATVKPPPEWSGSLLLLMSCIMQIRDAPLRETFFEALLALLRCCRVSSDEKEPLHDLLDRAAAVLAEAEVERCMALVEIECVFLQNPPEPVGVAQGATHGNGKKKAGGAGADARMTKTGARTAGNDPFAATRTASSIENHEKNRERRVLIAGRRKLLAATLDDRTKRFSELLREVIDITCDCGILTGMSASRLTELQSIQTSDLIPVEVAPDPLLPLNNTKGGRKR